MKTVIHLLFICLLVAGVLVILMSGKESDTASETASETVYGDNIIDPPGLSSYDELVEWSRSQGYGGLVGNCNRLFTNGDTAPSANGQTCRLQCHSSKFSMSGGPIPYNNGNF